MIGEIRPNTPPKSGGLFLKKDPSKLSVIIPDHMQPSSSLIRSDSDITPLDENGPYLGWL
jgi:hypothetical protein